MNNNQEINYRKQKTKSRIAWGFAYFFAILWLLVALIPFIFMIFNSFRKQFDMLTQGVFHMPDPWYFDNYPHIVENGFFGYFGRSVFIVALSLVIMLIIAAFPYEIQTEKPDLCRHRSLYVHPDARNADPHLQDDQRHASA